MAVTNNFEIDVKVKCVENDLTQVKLGEMIGSTGQYVNRVIKKNEGIVNRTFVEIMDALGYDITLTYTPKKREGKE